MVDVHTDQVGTVGMRLNAVGIAGGNQAAEEFDPECYGDLFFGRGVVDVELVIFDESGELDELVSSIANDCDELVRSATHMINVEGHAYLVSLIRCDRAEGWLNEEMVVEIVVKRSVYGRSFVGHVGMRIARYVAENREGGG